MRTIKTIAILITTLLCSSLALAQESRPLSPRGKASTQVGGEWVVKDDRTRYVGGKWLDVEYGRPIKRDRENLFGSGENYGEKLNGGAPVWRAGANAATRLRTEAPLMIGGKHLDAGEYSLFIELKENSWTLIVSNHDYLEKYDREEKVKVWGSYGYQQSMDALRVPMQLSKSTHSVDQLTIGFIDVTKDSGKLVLLWDKEFASVEFSVMM